MCVASPYRTIKNGTVPEMRKKYKFEEKITKTK
jgi:hypothetical protein